jgi:nitrous oxide reductase
MPAKNSSKSSAPKLDRRRFLAVAAVAGATGATGAVKPGQAATVQDAQERRPSALPPNAHVAAAETGTPQMPARDNGTHFAQSFVRM